MGDSTKYLIHLDVVANGVVERSDVVGAIFGQTEGLLGEEMNLHELQQASRVGRIDVEVESERGRSIGRITIASSMDTVETAVLGAALETVERIGPCDATLTVDRIEDVRSATRRAVVDRAEELIATAFEDTVMNSEELLETVRERVRVADIVEYDGYPAGPRVHDSDAIIVVEGRSDVLNLLKYGIKNAVAVEGTDVPESIAELTRERTTTAFLDGDRGGELILKELEQVGGIDAVAFAPPGRGVEDLDRSEVLAALRQKVPLSDEFDVRTPMAFASDVWGTADREAANGAGGTADGEAGARDEAAAAADPDVGVTSSSSSSGETAVAEAAEPAPAHHTAVGVGEVEGADEVPPETGTGAPTNSGTPGAGSGADETSGETEDPDGRHAVVSDGTNGIGPGSEPAATLRDHVTEVQRLETAEVRLLDDDFELIERGVAGEAFDLVADAEPVPHTVVLGGELDQRLLDVAAQRGVAQIVASSIGELTKRPLGVRLRTADGFDPNAAAGA